MAGEKELGGGPEAPYAALWQFPADRGVHEYVEDQLATWLREKGIDADLSQSGIHRSGDNRLFVARHHSRGAPEFQVRLVEHNASGIWRTELTTRTPDADAGWLRLRVTNDGGRYVAPPRLATYLLASGEFRDGGSLGLTERPTVVSSTLVEDVAEVITDFSREGLVFVAGTDDQLPFDPFRRLVEKWTREVVGLAEVYVLDPHATRDMAEILGEWHAVDPWTIRTFLPDVDPALEDNARRHRRLGTARLAGWPVGRIQRTLGRVARGHAESRPLPEPVMHSLRAFVRMENQLLVESVGNAAELESRLEAARPAAEVQVSPEPAGPAADVEAAPAETPPEAAADVAEEAAAYLRSLEVVRQVLDLPEVTEDTLRAFMADLSARQQAARDELSARLAEQDDEIARLGDELDDFRRQLEDAEEQAGVAVEEAARLRDVEQWLRRQFRSTEQAWLVSAPIPTEERTVYPTSFAELLDRLEDGSIPRVVFTGDPAETSVLDLHQGLDVALATCFDVLLALRDYARVKEEGWSGGVDTYLRNIPDGCRAVSPKSHAATESETVLNRARFRRQRIFPVPKEVDSSEEVLMTAHFKLGVAGRLSPRLYYLDDTGRTGKVYVGYIGKHLENTKTN